MLVHSGAEVFDCFWRDYGFTYTAISIYKPNRNWLQRKLGWGRLAIIPCTRAYGFGKCFFDEDFHQMDAKEFSHICHIAITRYCNQRLKSEYKE